MQPAVNSRRTKPELSRQRTTGEVLMVHATTQPFREVLLGHLLSLWCLKRGREHVNRDAQRVGEIEMVSLRWST